MNKPLNLIVISVIGLGSTLPLFGLIAYLGVTGPIAHSAQYIGSSQERFPMDIFWWLGDPTLSLDTRSNLFVACLGVWALTFVTVLVIGVILQRKHRKQTDTPEIIKKI